MSCPSPVGHREEDVAVADRISLEEFAYRRSHTDICVNELIDCG